MDLDDFDDLESEKPKLPSRVSKFLPKSSTNKAVPKTEPAPPRPQQQPDASILKKPKNEDDLKPTTTNLSPKTEPSASNGAVKMETKPMPEVEMNPIKDEAVDSNRAESDLEDMIVREFDVYFTPSVDADTQLYIIQYPLRPSWRPYELDERCEEVRVKPETAEVEIDLSIDVDSNNWNNERANSVNMTKQTLKSSWKPPRLTGYAVGVLDGNKLHLNPIHAVVQLRPSMEHLRSGGSKRKNNVTDSVEVAVKLEDSNEDKSVGPSKKQNKRMDVAVTQKSNDKECWVALKYHGFRSDLSARYLQKMLAQENSLLHFTMNPYDYVTSLCPGVSVNNIKSKGHSRRFLLSMPLEERLRKLLCEGPPIHRFSALKHFAPDDSIEDVLGVLQKQALFVQGLWAPRSGLLFEDKQTCLARDYVLLQFYKSLVVKSEQFLINTKLNDHIKRFLKVFATERPSFKDWKFKNDRDVSFIKDYPDVVEKQEQVWATVEKQITDIINRVRKVVPTKNDVPGKSGTINKPLKSNKGASGVPTGKRPMSNEIREALPKALHKIFRSNKVCSIQLICEGLRDMAVAQNALPKADARMALLAAEGIDTADFEEVINQVAINIHGFYVSKSSQEHPEYDQLRKLVIDLLIVRGPNAKLKKAEIEEVGKRAFDKKDIPWNDFKKAMSDICEANGGAWVLKKPK